MSFLTAEIEAETFQVNKLRFEDLKEFKIKVKSAMIFWIRNYLSERHQLVIKKIHENQFASSLISFLRRDALTSFG